MIFPIHIGLKLDLSNFRMHARRYMTMRKIHYHIYLPDFKIIVELTTSNNSHAPVGFLWLEDLVRDNGGEIIGTKTIFPLLDTRFKEMKDIQNWFEASNYRATVLFDSIEETITMICQVIKLLHKLNGLRAFL
jgi:hypothetical protein